jgi:hypothetical protein
MTTGVLRPYVRWGGENPIFSLAGQNGLASHADCRIVREKKKKGKKGFTFVAPDTTVQHHGMEILLARLLSKGYRASINHHRSTFYCRILLL